MAVGMWMRLIANEDSLFWESTFPGEGCDSNFLELGCKQWVSGQPGGTCRHGLWGGEVEGCSGPATTESSEWTGAKTPQAKREERAPPVHSWLEETGQLCLGADGQSKGREKRGLCCCMSALI